MEKLRRRFLPILLLTAAFLIRLKADDEVTCCMSGMKSVRGVALCRAPCCPGYAERVERPPLLAPVVYCNRDMNQRSRDDDEGGRKLAEETEAEAASRIRQELLRYYAGKK